MTSPSDFFSAIGSIRDVDDFTRPTQDLGHGQ